MSRSLLVALVVLWLASSLVVALLVFGLAGCVERNYRSSVYPWRYSGYSYPNERNDHRLQEERERRYRGDGDDDGHRH